VEIVKNLTSSVLFYLGLEIYFNLVKYKSTDGSAKAKNLITLSASFEYINNE